MHEIFADCRSANYYINLIYLDSNNGREWRNWSETENISYGTERVTWTFIIVW